MWREGQEVDGSGEARWEAIQGPTGHFDEVKSVAWGGREGREWLVSVRFVPRMSKTCIDVT